VNVLNELNESHLETAASSWCHVGSAALICLGQIDEDCRTCLISLRSRKALFLCVCV
jgi:hypothetical protein